MSQRRQHGSSKSYSANTVSRCPSVVFCSIGVDELLFWGQPAALVPNYKVSGWLRRGLWVWLGALVCAIPVTISANELHYKAPAAAFPVHRRNISIISMKYSCDLPVLPLIGVERIMWSRNLSLPPLFSHEVNWLHDYIKLRVNAKVVS